MVPRTYPSTFAANGQQQMVVYFLTSISGLQRWVDYIPVKLTQGGTENSYNNDGFISIALLPELTSQTQAWKEYIPVYQDDAATDAWQVSSIGFIPYNYDKFEDASLFLDFTNGGALDSRITFSRGSNATVTGSNGLIQYAPHNLLTFSEQFDNAAWVKVNGAVVTANAIVAPDGTTTADLLAKTTTGFQAVRQSITLASDTTVSESVHAKKGLSDYIAFTDNASCVLTVDLRDGTITRNTMFSSVVVTPVGNGWFRISYSRSRGAGANNALYMWPTDVASSAAFTTSSSVSCYIWGAQLNVGSLQPYYPTTNSAYYGPRFDYDPVTLAPKGLLIEEQRTNLLTYSEQFDNAAWSKFNSSVSSNSSVAPDGTSTADKLVATVDNSVHAITGINVPTGAHTVSVFAKTGGYSWLIIRAQGLNTFFNLSTGTVGTVASGATASIASVGNGWYRCSIIVTGNNTAAFSYRVSNSGSTDSFAGDGTSGLFIWGAQLEAGAFATSYIPTVASQVTRSADSASMTGTNFSSWYNASEGTLFSNFDWLGLTSNDYCFSIGTNANNTIGLGVNTSGLSRFIVISGGASQASYAFSAVTANVPIKLAGAYKLNDFNAAAAGVTGTTDTSGTVPSATSAQFNSSVGGGNDFNGHLRSIAYYPRRLSNTELQIITS
jgi:hypothetical protein